MVNNIKEIVIVTKSTLSEEDIIEMFELMISQKGLVVTNVNMNVYNHFHDSNKNNSVYVEYEIDDITCYQRIVISSMNRNINKQFYAIISVIAFITVFVIIARKMLKKR